MPNVYKRYLICCLAVLLIACLLVTPPVDAKKKEKKGKVVKGVVEKSYKIRTLYYQSFEKVPPHLNYLRDVFDSADAVRYIRSKISRECARKGYKAKNFELISNRIDYEADSLFMRVETKIKFKDIEPDYRIKVVTKLQLFERKGGKKIFGFKGKGIASAASRYRKALHDAIDEALYRLREMPAFSELRQR